MEESIVISNNNNNNGSGSSGEEDGREKIITYTEEEKQKWNGYFFGNKLENTENMISNFENFKEKYGNPHDLSYHHSENIVAISDFATNMIALLDNKGKLLFIQKIKQPRNIELIPSLNILIIAFVSSAVEVYDITPIREKQHTAEAETTEEEIKELPHMYTIGSDKVEGIHSKFKSPQGLRYAKKKQILAISDWGNSRIEIFHIRRDGFEHYGFIPSLGFKPNWLDISNDGDQMVVIGHSGSNQFIRYFKSENEGRSWNQGYDISLKEIGCSPAFTRPNGVAIHSRYHYFAVNDEREHRVLFFDLRNGKLIHVFEPLFVDRPSSAIHPQFFHCGSAIIIDESSDVIAVADDSSLFHSVTVFHSPIFDD